jgi:hypothetical protein
MNAWVVYEEFEDQRVNEIIDEESTEPETEWNGIESTESTTTVTEGSGPINQPLGWVSDNANSNSSGINNPSTVSPDSLLWNTNNNANTQTSGVDNDIDLDAAADLLL